MTLLPLSGSHDVIRFVPVQVEVMTVWSGLSIAYWAGIRMSGLSAER
jgi:hypothetical protein